VRTFYGQGDSSDADVRTFRCKNLDLLNFMVCPHRQGGRAGVNMLQTRGERVIFV